MSIKIKVIKESIKRIDKRISELKGIIYANPLSDIIEVRKKAQAILIKHSGDYKKIGKLIDPLAKEEKRLFALAKKQKNTNNLINEQVKLESELSTLKSELYLSEKKHLK